MTMYVIFEVIKVVAWVIMLALVVNKRHKMSIGLFWTSSVSSLLMAMAGVQDIIHYEHLADKSGWWLVANIFILATYYTMVKNSCRFYDEMKIDIDNFQNEFERKRKEDLKKLKQDKKTLL